MGLIILKNLYFIVMMWQLMWIIACENLLVGFSYIVIEDYYIIFIFHCFSTFIIADTYILLESLLMLLGIYLRRIYFFQLEVNLE
jgi:hypothetical protein